MSTGLKIALGIIGGIGIVIIALIFVGARIGKSMVGTMEDATKFAASATKDECVGELSNRLKSCEGVTCMVGLSAWGAGCLNAAKGNQQEFCTGIPSQQDVDTFNHWQEKLCQDRGLTQEKCAIAGAIVGGYCTSATSAK